MATLWLLRHAKSSWDDASLADHDRPLAPRGQRAAVLMRAYLEQQAVAPQRIVCSTALRTRQTLSGVLPAFDPEPEVRFEASVYAASWQKLLEAVRQHGADVERLMLVGHNPGLAELGLSLGSRRNCQVRARLSEKFPTGAWLELRLDSLAEAEPGRATLQRFVPPKELV